MPKKTLRSSIERASLPVIKKLNSLSKAVPFLLLVTLLGAGVLIDGPVGFVLMGLAVLFVAWILYLSWPGLTGTERIMRAAVLLLAVAITISRHFPRS